MMEEATVTNLETTEQAGVPQGTPSPFDVTDDDLKKEIAEWLVSGLQKDKVIKYLSEQVLNLNAMVSEQQEFVAKSMDVVKSNKLLSDKNVGLGNELTTARGVAKTAEADSKKANKDLEDSKKALVLAESKVNEKNIEIGLLRTSEREAKNNHTALQKETNVLMKDIGVLETKITSIEADNADIICENTSLKDENTSLNDKIDALKLKAKKQPKKKTVKTDG